MTRMSAPDLVVLIMEIEPQWPLRKRYVTSHSRGGAGHEVRLVGGTAELGGGDLAHEHVKPSGCV